MDKAGRDKIASIINKELSRPVARKRKKNEVILNIFLLFNGVVFIITSAAGYSHSFTGEYQGKSLMNSEIALRSGNEFEKDGDRTNEKEDAGALISTINHLVKNGRYDEALKNIDALINIEQSNVSAYKVKASCLHLLGRDEEAIEVFSEAVKMEPGDNNSYKMMGDISLKKDQYEDAIEYYKKALAISDEDDPVYQNLGVAAAKLGRFDEALEYYEQALRLNPENAEVLENKQEILVRLGVTNSGS